jgi:sugar phosphate isomerase/epimerase
VNVLCSTGAVTRNPRWTDHSSILRHGPSLDADGLELVVYAAWYPQLELVAGALRTSGLLFPVVHAEKTIGAALASENAGEVDGALERLEANCRLARTLGAGTLVFHLWELPQGDRLLERNLGHLAACADLAAAHGLVLALETIPCSVGSPLENVRRAVEREPRCGVTLDTEFLALHDQLGSVREAGWLWEPGLVRHVHVKDYDGELRSPDGRRRYLFPGDGSLDLDGFLAGIAEQGFRGTVTLEASALDDDTGHVDLERLAPALRWLRAAASP